MKLNKNKAPRGVIVSIVVIILLTIFFLSISIFGFINWIKSSSHEFMWLYDILRSFIGGLLGVLCIIFFFLRKKIGLGFNVTFYGVIVISLLIETINAFFANPQISSLIRSAKSNLVLSGISIALIVYLLRNNNVKNYYRLNYSNN